MFQYISCCSLSVDGIVFPLKIERFNTSHVVVYLPSSEPGDHPAAFQYISCCSLSRPFLACCVFCSCFNTSHVVVYRLKQFHIDTVTKFQYISCCSLSRNGKGNEYAVWKFQYISCCSLSHIYMRFVINCFLIFHWNLNYYLNFYQPSYYFLIFQFQSSLMLELQHFYS